MDPIKSVGIFVGGVADENGTMVGQTEKSAGPCDSLLQVPLLQTLLHSPAAQMTPGLRQQSRGNRTYR